MTIITPPNYNPIRMGPKRQKKKIEEIVKAAQDGLNISLSDRHRAIQALDEELMPTGRHLAELFHVAPATITLDRKKIRAGRAKHFAVDTVHDYAAQLSHEKEVCQARLIAIVQEMDKMVQTSQVDYTAAIAKVKAAIVALHWQLERECIGSMQSLGVLPNAKGLGFSPIQPVNGLPSNPQEFQRFTEQVYLAYKKERAMIEVQPDAPEKNEEQTQADGRYRAETDEKEAAVAVAQKAEARPEPPVAI